MAHLFGAARIILLGYDMQGKHWHRDHAGKLHNPTSPSLQQWAKRFDQLAACKDLRAELINATRSTAIRRIPRMPLSEALADACVSRVA